ncbi:hypothetical protein VC83_09560 [Pseudogymnoascus destructans]|uniref:Retrotransposon gag domain-containing protein n=1 Tax=Pseudogymnoascus destructans TaxID=655981 RepID=A0A176ZW33_9PEZI|nr:uncharacterized protein VC83_09560 [Pseudogymnoascus destructans]OAF54165.1 hypothetical protein VC83_09560 [Pseudogymnoascus destructans]
MLKLDGEDQFCAALEDDVAGSIENAKIEKSNRIDGTSDSRLSLLQSIIKNSNTIVIVITVTHYSMLLQEQKDAQSTPQETGADSEAGPAPREEDIVDEPLHTPPPHRFPSQDQTSQQSPLSPEEIEIARPEDLSHVGGGLDSVHSSEEQLEPPYESLSEESDDDSDEESNMANAMKVPAFSGEPTENIEVSIMAARIAAESLGKRWGPDTTATDKMFARVMMLQGALKGAAATFGSDLLNRIPEISFDKFCQDLRSRFPPIPRKIVEKDARQKAMTMSQDKGEKVQDYLSRAQTLSAHLTDWEKQEYLGDQLIEGLSHDPLRFAVRSGINAEKKSNPDLTVDLPFIVNFITSTLDLKDATPSVTKGTKKEITWQTIGAGATGLNSDEDKLDTLIKGMNELRHSNRYWLRTSELCHNLVRGPKDLLVKALMRPPTWEQRESNRQKDLDQRNASTQGPSANAATPDSQYVHPSRRQLMSTAHHSEDEPPQDVARGWQKYDLPLCMVDGGASINIMSEATCRQLGLEVVQQEMLGIKTANNTSEPCSGFVQFVINTSGVTQKISV